MLQLPSSYKTVGEAVDAVVNSLGMQCIDGSGSVQAGPSVKKHAVLLAGKFCPDEPCLAHAIVHKSGSEGAETINLNIRVRSRSERITQTVLSSVTG